MLIAIEGIDGSGKTTQVELLARALRNSGKEVVTSKEPTNGQFGQQLRNSALTGRLAPEAELELFIRDRREHVETLISPRLKEGKIVILDRYYFSTIAYQSVRGFDQESIQRQNEEFAPLPDILFILDVSVEESLRRIGVRDGEGNDFEDFENLKKCREIFLGLDRAFIHVIDADRTPSAIEADLFRIVQEHQ